MREVNAPSTGVPIDEFCRSLGVKGLEKDITELRNKLTHTAAYGNFDLPKVLSLHVELSHVVDVCVLKILGYRGHYCRRATNWRNISLEEGPQVAEVVE